MSGYVASLRTTNAWVSAVTGKVLLSQVEKKVAFHQSRIDHWTATGNAQTAQDLKRRREMAAQKVSEHRKLVEEAQKFYRFLMDGNVDRSWPCTVDDLDYFRIGYPDAPAESAE